MSTEERKFGRTRATCFFHLSCLKNKQLLRVALLFVRNLHLNTHTNYVCKTYGRDSRSQEIGTSRESRDRCHLLRARIRHADVDQFVYQRQRLIFKGFKISLLLVLGAFLSLSSSSFILLRLQIECSGFDRLDAASICVYFFGSRLLRLLLLLLREAANARLLRILFLRVCEKRTRRRERTVVASSLSSRLYNKKILTITNRNNFTFVNARAIF